MTLNKGYLWLTKAATTKNPSQFSFITNALPKIKHISSHFSLVYNNGFCLFILLTLLDILWFFLNNFLIY